MELPHAVITVVGSLNMDMINVIEKHAKPNEHVIASKALRMSGGHGGNQAVACMRLTHFRPENVAARRKQSNVTPLVPHDLDLAVHMVGVVGSDDEHGSTIISDLRFNGVTVDKIKTVENQWTGYTHINVDKFGIPTISFQPCANEHFTPEMIQELKPLPDLLLIQLEIPLDTVQHVVQLAKEQDVPVILNAAPLKEGSPIPEELYHVDHLIMNEDQANKLRGFGAHSTIPELRTTAQYWEDCKHFHDMGARCVVITLGDRGAVASREERDRSKRKRQYYSEALLGPDGIKDNTGASDAFIGAYAVELLRQKKNGEEENIAEAIEMGIKAGGLAVSSMGSMDSIPWRKDVLKNDIFGGVPKRLSFHEDSSQENTSNGRNSGSYPRRW